MNYLDLFSGIGGFALGAYQAGWRFERHYFSEIDPWCCDLYQRRFPDALPLGDIRAIDGAELVADADGGGGEKSSQSGWPTRLRSGDCRPWIITGGFPCQDISVAGKGAGLDGERSGLWFEYARLIGEIRPRYAIMENVGVLTRRGLDRVLGSLAALGYDAEWSDIRASDVGAPHRRERIWIVAYPGRERGGEGRTEPQGRSREAVPVGGGSSPDAERDILRIEQGRGGGQGRSDTSEPLNDGEARTLADTDKIMRDGSRGTWDGRAESPDGGWWSVEPDVGRVAHGVPARVDRLRGLGNSIVPQIAEMIFRGLS